MKKNFSIVCALICTFLFVGPTVVYATMSVRDKTTMIVVHHSDSEQGNAESIRRYHVDHNKWDDIGYHYVITNGKGGTDGEVQTGRREDLQGAHAGKSGENRNSVSVGICLVGKEEFTDKQKDALVGKLVELCKKYNIVPSIETIQSHHEKCPGDILQLPAIIELVSKKMAE